LKRILICHNDLPLVFQQAALPRGKVIGGTFAMNDMIYQRGSQDIFNEDGSLSEFGTKIKKFVENTYSSIEKTKKSLKLFSDFDLLKTIDVNIDKGGQKYKLEAMLQIDTEKLNKLKDNQLLALLKCGAFNVIYAHSASISNISLVADRLED